MLNEISVPFEDDGGEVCDTKARVLFRRLIRLRARLGALSESLLYPIFCRANTNMDAGAGNCLFRALSDQLYNTTRRHGEIRQSIVEYLRTNRSHFEPFVLANVEDDLIRSQPTTRSSRSRKSSVDQDPFEVYLENMAKPNTWGGDIEITAFCEVFDKDVLIHRPTDSEKAFTQVVNSKRAAGQPKDHVHISFGVSTPSA